jgi:hypothetical protein
MSMQSEALDVVDKRAAAVATAPRITKEFIEENITHVVTITGDTFVIASGSVEGGPSPEDAEPFAHLTMCIIRTKNGFMVTGQSAPMDPRNYNEELGVQLSYEDAFRKLWPLYAFAAMEDVLLDKEYDQLSGNARNDDGESQPNPKEE